jgi:hypothetical protein
MLGDHETRLLLWVALPAMWFAWKLTHILELSSFASQVVRAA